MYTKNHNSLKGFVLLFLSLVLYVACSDATAIPLPNKCVGPKPVDPKPVEPKPGVIPSKPIQPLDPWIKAFVCEFNKKRIAANLNPLEYHSSLHYGAGRQAEYEYFKSINSTKLPTLYKYGDALPDGDKIPLAGWYNENFKADAKLSGPEALAVGSSDKVGAVKILAPEKAAIGVGRYQGFISPYYYNKDQSVKVQTYPVDCK
ncbi:hypothetical protein H4219_006191 [Mycoemilia scoparia]|uniref:Uncharacterized protein n=1 Tax=Mycoemilia scoparia TaxID=417184 RepID=A0A9W7ZQ15_9FUNG|nr:hypothetical protein H4219_006191 [Mycoemilia scoparia]